VGRDARSVPFSEPEPRGTKGVAGFASVAPHGSHPYSIRWPGRPRGGGTQGSERDVVTAHHSHDHGDLPKVPVAGRARALLLLFLAGTAAFTVIGLLRLWPEHEAVRGATSDVQYAANGVSFPHATITHVLPACDPSSYDKPQPAKPTCGEMDVSVDTGPDSGQDVTIQMFGPMAAAGLVPGDSVQLMRIPMTEGDAATLARGDVADAQYAFFGVDRTRSMAFLTIAFVVIVLLVARLRGLMALLGLVFAGLVVVKFVLPALLVGESGLAVALVGASAIMFVVLYLAHGPSMRTSAALAGTLVGIGITALVAHTSVGANRLSGMSDETGGYLSAEVGHLNFTGLLTAAIIIAGLGVLNDVTITQASAVWELRAAGPDLSRRQVFGSAMRIGRDHIASTIYTIVFAYAGAALTVLLLLFLYNQPFLNLLGTEDIGAEVVRTLASSIGLVLAVPVTTAIAVLTVSAKTMEEVHPDSPYRKRPRRRRRPEA
jgi:uncharacterized membrane protein